MFCNLEAELARAHMKKKDLAVALSKKNSSNLSLKLSGKRQFTLDEMVAIKKIFGNKFSLDYLFESDSESKATKTA